jgi:hypothetical protein
MDLEPPVVGNELLVDVHTVERAGLLALVVGALTGGGVIDLDFETFVRKTGLLVCGAEEDIGSCTWDARGIRLRARNS